MFVTSDLSIPPATGVTKISANRTTSRVPYSGSPSSPVCLRDKLLQHSRGGMPHLSRIAKFMKDSTRRSRSNGRKGRLFDFAGSIQRGSAVGNLRQTLACVDGDGGPAPSNCLPKPGESTRHKNAAKEP